MVSPSAARRSLGLVFATFQLAFAFAGPLADARAHGADSAAWSPAGATPVARGHGVDDCLLCGAWRWNGLPMPRLLAEPAVRGDGRAPVQHPAGEVPAARIPRPVAPRAPPAFA